MGGTVMVGMSGGVDSSLAAHLLLEQGHKVEGLFMKNWEEDDGSQLCTAPADLASARAVAAQLGIKLHLANFAAEYWERVFADFIKGHRAGQTPNPDILCNSRIKFKCFLQYARELGAARIATGHYARLVGDAGAAGGVQLHRAADAGKDQTYFLYAVKPQALAHSIFPLGDLIKTEVRARARALGLASADRPDSTGICFIGPRRFRDFLARYIKPAPGPIESLDGTALGRHQGLAAYTIGQRQGLGIGGVRGAPEAPWFVCAKDARRNALIVVQGDHPALYANALQLRQLHWLGAPPAPGEQILARIRHRQPLQQCRLERDLLHFARPQRAITPGQSAVLYRDSLCLGGGIIERALHPPADAPLVPTGA